MAGSRAFPVVIGPAGYPLNWSTAALIDWMNIVRVKIPNRSQMLERIRHALVARMDRQGTAMVFADTGRNSSGGSCLIQRRIWASCCWLP